MKTYKDIYEFPLKKCEYGNWVYDQKDQFVFQFKFNDRDKRALLLSTINGESKLTNTELKFEHKDGYIQDGIGMRAILIRGWGNLTGTGGHNLSEEEGANVQDTFAEFIVKQLNSRD